MIFYGIIILTSQIRLKALIFIAFSGVRPYLKNQSIVNGLTDFWPVNRIIPKPLIEAPYSRFNASQEKCHTQKP